MGVLMPGPRAWIIIAAMMALSGCGGGGLPGARILPGPAGRINPIYDAMLVFPETTLIIAGMSYQGLELDLAIEFDESTLRDQDPSYQAEARVVRVMAGGVVQPFVLHGPLLIDGSLEDQLFTTGLFGPIHVGTASLLPEMVGTLDDAGGRVTGDATLFGITDNGFFTSIKRRRYLVAGTDLATIGKVSIISVRYDSQFSIETNLAFTSSDPIALVEDDRPFIVNRFSFDSLQGLDPASRFDTTFEYSTGNGSNPHDVVVFPSRDGGTPSGVRSSDGPGLAFVTRYEPPFNDVAIMYLEDDEIIDTIDLSAYARNPDGLPRPDQAILLDGLIYVTLQDVNARFTRFENGRVVVIDPRLRDVIDVIDLDGVNPFESLIYSEQTGLLYAGMAGVFAGRAERALTGGIEAIDPATRRSLGLVVDDDDLGGNVTRVAIHSATLGYAVVTDESFRNLVKTFNPSTGEVFGTVYENFSGIAALVLDGDGYLLIAEGSFASRILVFDAATARVVTILSAVPPPFSVAVLTRDLFLRPSF